jgi:thiol-disulfide isomerase/thioredoxin
MKARTLLVAALLVPAGWAPAAELNGWEILRTPAREFQVQDVTGRTLRSSELRGKVVVLDFWATWCGPCLKELPGLAAYELRLQDRKDVAFLSMNVTEEKDTVTKFIEEKGIQFPIYLGDSLLGPFEVSTFPTKLVLDMRLPAKPGHAGVLRFRKEGFSTVASIEARVAALLAEKH